jgi:hypothetical protein
VLRGGVVLLGQVAEGIPRLRGRARARGRARIRARGRARIRARGRARARVGGYRPPSRA